MNIGERLNNKGDKILYFFDNGRGKGQRGSLGLFTYVKPKDALQRNHNKETIAILEVKRGQAIIDQQATGTGYIPSHKFKANFLDYYEEYVQTHKRKRNRHLQNSLKHFKTFINRKFISPIEISENFCKSFRRYLLDNFNGETPLNYFARFKWVVDAAKSDGYFKEAPTKEIAAQSNPSASLKENLEADEYLKLLKSPCVNQQIKTAFLFSCYTGLRWVDVKTLRWQQLKGNNLVTRIIQKKTGRPVVLTLHPIAEDILNEQAALNNMDLVHEPDRQKKLVFQLPSQDGSNKTLQNWIIAAGINKHITWSCARLSFSILLQDKRVDDATVAYLMGHTTTEQVQRTYKRHRPHQPMEAIMTLPHKDNSKKDSTTNNPIY